MHSFFRMQSLENIDQNTVTHFDSTPLQTLIFCALKVFIQRYRKKQCKKKTACVIYWYGYHTSTVTLSYLRVESCPENYTLECMRTTENKIEQKRCQKLLTVP